MSMYGYAEVWSPETVAALPLSAIRFAATTRYQQVVITDGPNGRSLFLDGVHQSSEGDEFIYHELLVHPAMLRHHCPRRVLILGGGEGATLREVLRHPSVTHVTMVDLDEELVAICREQLPAYAQGAFEDPRLHLVFEDAIQFLRSYQGPPFDVAIMDLCEPDAAHAGLYTPEVMQLVWLALGRGVLGTHAGAIHYGQVQTLATVQRAIRTAFHHAAISLCPELQWAFLVASDLPLLPPPPSRYQALDLRYLNSAMDQWLGALPTYLIKELSWDPTSQPPA